MIIAAEREETYEKVYKVWKDNTGREILSILWNESSGQCARVFEEPGIPERGVK